MLLLPHLTISLFQILLMKVNGLLSMIASHFITRDVLIRYNKGERIRLTYEIVFEVRDDPLLHFTCE